MQQTVLYEWHETHGGRMVDFAGWHMPIQYTSIVQEHHAVRRRAGLFDISHMGRIWFSGPGAQLLLDRLLTNCVSTMRVNQVRYALVCHESGGVLDDVLIYRFPEKYLLVVNGANREKIGNWIEQHRRDFDVKVEDTTLETCMMALQGPVSETLLQSFVDCDLASIKYYHAVQANISGVPAVISRTGYTGEDGFEVTVSNEAGPNVWQSLLDAGSDQDVLPCGLGCRDTLRLEAGMPLYGHELDEETDPLTAGLGFAVKLEKPDFIGKSALVALSSQSDLQKRVGLQLAGKRIARQGAELYQGDRLVGKITSGTFSPTLEASLAMGYVAADTSAPDTVLDVDIRGKREPARIVPLPFYKRRK